MKTRVLGILIIILTALLCCQMIGATYMSVKDIVGMEKTTEESADEDADDNEEDKLFPSSELKNFDLPYATAYRFLRTINSGDLVSDVTIPPPKALL